jgi:hypothetical protein
VDRLPAGLRDRALLNGFAYPDGKFRFKPDWPKVPFRSPRRDGAVADMPRCPTTGRDRGGRRARIRSGSRPRPARGFLNSTFNETPSSRAKNGGGRR